MTADEVERSLEEDRQAYYREMGWVNEERDRYLRPQPRRPALPKKEGHAWWQWLLAIVLWPVIIVGSLFLMTVATMGWPW